MKQVLREIPERSLGTASLQLSGSPLKVFVLIDGAFGELLLVGAGKPSGCGEQELG